MARRGAYQAVIHKSLEGGMWVTHPPFDTSYVVFRRPTREMEMLHWRKLGYVLAAAALIASFLGDFEGFIW